MQCQVFDKTIRFRTFAPHLMSDSIMVVRQILALKVRVRALVGQPRKKSRINADLRFQGFISHAVQSLNPR